MQIYMLSIAIRLSCGLFLWINTTNFIFCMSKMSKTGIYMKQFLVALSALVLFQSASLFAKDGYKIKIKTSVAWR